MRYRAGHKATGPRRRAEQGASGSRSFGRLRPGTLSIALASLLFFALALPATVQAATAYDHVGEFGGLGSALGEFGVATSQDGQYGPGRVAVHEQSGRIFVADTANDRIQVFDPVHPGLPGTACAPCADSPFEFGVSDAGDDFDLSQPIGISIDQVTADVYVMAAGDTDAIVKFEANDSADPTAYAHVEPPDFTSPDKGTDTGEIGSFGEIGPVGSLHRGGIAVDNSGGAGQGDILIADPGRDLIQRFDSSGAYINDFNGSVSPDEAFQDLFDIAVDSTGDILVVDHIGGNEGEDEGVRVERFDASGNWQATLPMPEDIGEMHDFVIGAMVATNPSPGSDEVFVGFKPPGPSGTPEATPWRIAQFEINEEGDDELITLLDAPGDRFDWFILGIGVRADELEEGKGRLYALALNGHASFGAVPRVQVFDAVGTLGDPPVPEMCEEDPVTDVGATQATFCGTVDHGGIEAEWRFEYRAVGGPTAWLPAPVPNGQLDGTEVVPVDVQATVTDLEPNTGYEVRLWAENGVTDRVTDAETFVTDAVPPVVSNLTVVPGSTMVSVWAEVNPRNSESSWRIEYRPAGSGQWTEVSAGSAGDGGTPVPVLDRVYGLNPSSQYEVRVIAENATGTHADVELVTTGAAHPERVYELASPLPTGGVSVDSGSGLMGGRAASEDGDRALISTFAVSFPGMDKLYQRYVAERGADGWTTRPVDEQPSGFFATMSADGSHVLFEDQKFGFTGDHDPDDQNQALDLYLRGPDGELTWISRDPRIPPGQPQTDGADMHITNGSRPSMMSADGRTVAFMSRRNLLDADPHPSSGAHSDGRLYKWSDGELELIGVLPGASDPPQPGDVPTAGWLLGQGNGWFPNAVSNDGSRVFWSAGGTIYVSIDGHDTIEVAAGIYRGAAADGSRVFYTSGGDLYAYDVDVALSGSGDPVTSITDDGEVLGVAGIADFGTHAYFVSNAVIAEAESGPAGTEPSQVGRNLYRANLSPNGSVDIRFVAGPLGGSTQGQVPDSSAIWASSTGSSWTWLQSFATRDGSLLAFGSLAELIPGQSTGGFRQMYVYDDEENSLVCASCMADGSDPLGVVNVEDVGSRRSQVSNTNPRWVTDDGTLFFESYSPLLPEVTNNATDVYAYRDGELTLISAGAGLQPSTFHAASADGSTVFFRTGDSLVPVDNEPGVIKLYAARIGGGIESQHQLPPDAGVPCVGEACRDDAGEPESPARASTEEFRGAGDRAAEPQCAVYVRQVRAATQRAARLARRGRALGQVARRLAHRGANPRRVIRVRRLSVQATRAARAQTVRARDARERLEMCRGLGRDER